MDDKIFPTQNSESCCGGSVPSKESCCSDPTPVSESCCADQAPAGDSCCASAEAAIKANSPAAEQFSAFMQAVNRPGALDAPTKLSIALALSVLAKCEPCLKIHIQKAQEMGFTLEEIDEAAWMAIGFGGSPVMMFYNGVKAELLQNSK